MTAGSVLSLKNFGWGGLKPKKRRRSGCGGSTDYEAKKKSPPLLRSKQKDDNRNKNGNGGGSGRHTTGSSNLEVIAPVTSDVEFKYTWPIEGFLARVGNGSGSGLDSEPFDVNVNGVRTSWNLSIRFWTGEDGERLANPFVLCLNLLSCRCVDVGRVVTAGIRFRFGVLNRSNDEYELGAPDHEQVKELRFDDATMSVIRSVGYKNVTLSEKHTNSRGDVQLVCKLSLAKDDSGTHSLSSDLKNLMKDEKSADLVIEAAGGKQFKVHRNILSARSPVFASLISRENSSGGGGGGALGKVKIADLKAEILEELLDYIYTDTTTSVTNVPDALLAASDLYKLPGLKSHCERNLAEVISPANVATVLLLADRHACEGLKASALNYCKDNHNYIVKDSNWKTIEEERPGLFEEAVTKVVGDEVCKEHSECIKKRGKRFEMEKADGSSSSTGLGR